MWESVCKTDPRWVKFVTFTGLSEINPQYRFRSMTKLFGPLGLGWRYEIVKDVQGKPIEYVEQSRVSGEVYYSVLVAVYVRDRDSGEWFRAGEQYGTGYYVEKSSKGERDVQENARKGAVTDALGKIFSHFGIGSDVYEGEHDPNRQRDREPETRNRQSSQGNRPAMSGAGPAVSGAKPAVSGAPPLPEPPKPPAPPFQSQTRANWSRDGKPVPIMTDEDWSRFHTDIIGDARRAGQELGVGPGTQAILATLVKSVNNRHPHVTKIGYTDLATAIQSWRMIATDLATECKLHGVTKPQEPEGQPETAGTGS